jgi:uncharacterized membrane protein YvbJ
MSCIKNDIIQKYIDGEATQKEVAFIEKHIVNCEKCTVKIADRLKNAIDIKKAINVLVADLNEIPKIILPPDQLRKHIITRKMIIYSISAACILLFIFVALHKKEPEKLNQRTVIYSLVPDVNANLPVTKQKMIINVFNSNGNITEYYIK